MCCPALRRGTLSMALYTRTGDKGFTLLPGPEGNGPLRVRKDDARMIAMGDLDELNAAVGVAAAEAVREGNDRIGKHLTTMQEDLLRVGAVLAGVFGGRKVSVGLGPAAVKRIEKHIDAITAELPKLTNFILPGGGELAARLHLARAISRRTERDVVSALNLSNHSGQANSPQAVIVRYINRLSDFLFTLARLANHQADIKDHTWQGKK